MAKKVETKVTLTSKDKKTLGSLKGLADEVVSSADRGRAPHLEVPSRSLSNVKFNKSKRFIEMGSGTNRRELFNLAQAKAYMQTLLVGSGCKRLVEQGKTTSLRGLYYMLKHTIEGTKEETFDEQGESDTVIEDVEVTLNAMREELHLYAKKRRRDGRPITIVDSGDEIDCSHGLGRLQHPVDLRTRDRAVQEVQRSIHPACRKGHGLAAFQRGQVLVEHKCILTHGGGQPPRGVRRLLNRLHHELKLPVSACSITTPGGTTFTACLSRLDQSGVRVGRMAIPIAGTSVCAVRILSVVSLVTASKSI